MDAQIDNLTKQLESLYQKQSMLMKSLNQSLKIKGMWPGAFRYGSCKSYVYGDSTNLKDYKFIIVNGRGIKREFPLLDVSIDLWRNTADNLLDIARRYRAGGKYVRMALTIKKLLKESNEQAKC